MRSTAIAVLLLAAFCEASPSFNLYPRPTSGSESAYINGGEDVKLGEFPWQLDMEVFFEARVKWVHYCGASLLSSRYALTGAFCVYGIPVESIRVIAGVVDRTSPDGVISNVASYTPHEDYRQPTPSDEPLRYDIAILTLASPIYANGDNIQYATLPDNSDDLFVGESGFISGWERTDASSESPLILQKARIGVIDTDTCNQKREPRNSPIIVDDTQICLFDEAHRTRSCNDDKGGPFNLENKQGQLIVAGVASWIPKSIKSEGNGVCIAGAFYGVVYTRVSVYLGWIKEHTP